MITTTTIGSKEEPYPMISNVWDFFAEKGTKTVFVSVGTGKTCLPDLDFAETIGCKILKVDTPEDSKKWQDIQEVLKTRKITETMTDFSKPATRKWVLPKNLSIETCIPSSYNGSIQVDDTTTVPTKKWFEIVKEHCATLGLPEDQTHIDILKLDSSPHEAHILNSLWQTGFRPSLLVIHWTQSPEEDLQTLLTAAHLQMLGYALVGKEGNRFLYYYTDVNYYETCSWETVAKRFENPLISNLIKSVYPGTEGAALQFPLSK